MNVTFAYVPATYPDPAAVILPPTGNILIPAVAPVPDPPLTTTVGVDEYPSPACVKVIVPTCPSSVSNVAAATASFVGVPPPLKLICGTVE